MRAIITHFGPSRPSRSRGLCRILHRERALIDHGYHLEEVGRQQMNAHRDSVPTGDDERDWAGEFTRRMAGTMISSHGTRFVEVSAERAVLELDWKPELTQLTGLFHAGAIISLADEACTALASAHTMGSDGWDAQKFPLTVQLSASLIRNKIGRA